MLDVGLVQFNVDFASEYLPYSVAILQAYAEQFDEVKGAFRFRTPLYKRVRDVEPIARELASCEIVAFSIYVWNTEYSLKVARRIKELAPNVKIVFGGPNVADNSERFLRKNPCVDFTIHGEGEVAFKELLVAHLAGDYASVSGLRYLAAGEFRANPKPPRIRALETVPSPYLGGVFTELMARHPDQTWNVLWESNRGCPFSCTYCDWGSATAAKVNRFDMDRLMKELDWFSDHRIEYLMCADANFGILERDVAIAERLAELKKKNGYPMVFAATYTKNATERSYKIAQILLGAELIRGYTVSTQSIDEATLENIKRDNISQKTFTTLQARFNKDKLPTYTDLIIALPGETYDSFKAGVNEVIARGQYNKVYFFVVTVLPNAEMADPEYRALHGIETVRGPQKNLHEVVRKDDDDVTEYQEVVVATKTLPRDAWRKAVTFAYMASFLYFNKLLHVPMTSLLRLAGVRFDALVDAFMFDEARPDYPLLSRMNQLFADHAAQMQAGGTEYVASERWLNVWWQPDKLAFMEACAELDRFYDEARALLREVLLRHDHDALADVLDDAIAINKALVRQPFTRRPETVTLRSNVYDVYRAVMDQSQVDLRVGPCSYRLAAYDEAWPDRDEWCKRVVWYGNKTSAYLSEAVPVEAAQVPAKPKFSLVVLKPYLYA
jgi:radical SAM superfamily enzyme YgiQ (UPF0313 family)